MRRAFLVAATTASLTAITVSGAGFAAASPAPSHTPAHHVAGPRHNDPAHHVPSHHGVDPLAGQRKAASRALDADLARIDRLISKASQRTALHGTDATQLASALAAATSAVQVDQAAVLAATTRQGIHDALTSGVRTAQAAQLELTLITAADQAEDTADSLTTSADGLSTAAATLAAGGTDVSTVTTPLADLTSRVAGAQIAAQGAAATAFTLPAAPTAAQLRTIGHAATQQLAAARSGLQSAQADLAAATTALAALQPAPANP